MKINVSGQWEEWTQEKLDKALAEAEKWHREEEQKDWDEAWLCQWAATSKLALLRLIQEILNEPHGEAVVGVTCPACGGTASKRHGRYGPFYACMCGWKVSGGTKRLQKMLDAGQCQYVKELRPKAIAYNSLGNPCITLGKPGPVPTMGQLLGNSGR